MGLLPRAFHWRGIVHIVGTSSTTVGREPVSDEGRAEFNVIQKKGPQCRRLCIWDDLETTASEPLGLCLFHRHCNKQLPFCSPPSLPGFDTTNHCLVHFHIAVKTASSRSYHGITVAVEHRPYCLIGAEAEETVESFSRDTVLRGGHVPCCSEPQGQRCLRTMVDSPGRDRYPPSTPCAPPASIAKTPRRLTPATGAGKTVRPAQPIQVVETGIIIREPR